MKTTYIYINIILSGNKFGPRDVSHLAYEQNWATDQVLMGGICDDSLSSFRTNNDLPLWMMVLGNKHLVSKVIVTQNMRHSLCRYLVLPITHLVNASSNDW